MATDGECSAPARKAARPSGSGGSGSTSTSPRSAPSSPPLPGYVRVTRDREIGLHLVRMPELIVAVAQMDKATLLGEVVRELQAKASDATEVVLGVIPGRATRWASSRSSTTTTIGGEQIIITTATAPGMARGGSGRGCSAPTGRGSCPTLAAPCGPPARAPSALRSPPPAA
jgi:hypothetical protein